MSEGKPRMVLAECYYGTGDNRRLVSVADAAAIKATGGFTGECPKCGYRISLARESKRQAAHFQHSPLGNEDCKFSRPYRPAKTTHPSTGHRS